MSYSDYGGFAYRNGERVLERSDCAVGRDGGMGERARGITGHAVLGEPPLLLVLRKQTGAYVLLNGREVASFNPGPAFWNRHGKGLAVERSGGTAAAIEGVPEELGKTVFEIVHHDEDGRCAVYARVTTPGAPGGDRVVWTGWSAYGAGAGLEEDDSYHRGATNSAYHERKLKELLEK
jgi:hypothetical protein